MEIRSGFNGKIHYLEDEIDIENSFTS